MLTPWFKLPAIVLVIAFLWLLVRVLLEIPFPFIPFVTKNGFGRIVTEMPFYYATAWVCRIIGGTNEPPSHWAMTMAVAALEGICVGCTVLLVWVLFRCRG